MSESNPVFKAGVLCAIIFLTYLSFMPVLDHEFVNWDDTAHLYENELVRSLKTENIREIFRSRVGGVYLPLTLLSFAVEYHFFEYDPFIYHLNNLLLHLCVTVLIYLLNLRLGMPLIAAGITALFFGIHPVHVESVAWVTERKDVLYACFYLFSLHGYLSYLDLHLNKKQNAWPTAAGLMLFVVVSGALSMLAKPMAISLPLVLLLLDWFKKRRWTTSLFWEKLPILLICAGIGWMTYSVYARIPAKDPASAFLIWTWTLGFYLKQFFAPLDMVPIHSLPIPVELLNVSYIQSLLIIVLVILICIKYRKSRWVVFSVLYFILSIFFLLRFDKYDMNIVADRFLYLPSYGLCLLLGLVTWHIFKRRKALRPGFFTVFAVLMAMLCCLFMFKTHRYSKVWRNSFTLWRHQLAYNPDEVNALNNLGNAYRTHLKFRNILEKNRLTESEYPGLDLLERAERGFPEAVFLKYLIGLYEHALEVNPQFLKAYYNLAYLYKDLGQYQQALEKYGEYNALEPFDFEVHLFMGEVYQEMGKPEKAVEEYHKSLKLRPEDLHLYQIILNNLDMAIEKGGTSNSTYRKAKSEIFNLYGRFEYRRLKEAAFNRKMKMSRNKSRYR